jgi:hypothetical protein
VIPAADQRESLTVQVVPEPDVDFVRWEAADGTPVVGMHYAYPGETVFAVFEKK